MLSTRTDSLNDAKGSPLHSEAAQAAAGVPGAQAAVSPRGCAVQHGLVVHACVAHMPSSAPLLADNALGERRLRTRRAGGEQGASRGTRVGDPPEPMLCRSGGRPPTGVRFSRGPRAVFADCSSGCAPRPTRVAAQPHSKEVGGRAVSRHSRAGRASAVLGGDGRSR